MREVSFDCETLGIEDDAMILSIGAVRFDSNTGQMGPSFYRLLEIQDGPAAGSISASTVQWWMVQGEAARMAAFDRNLPRMDLRGALLDLVEFCSGAEVFWQRGDKDAQWLNSAYKRCGLGADEAPWEFWQLRDQRTLSVEFGHLVGKTARGTAHNALEDAKAQAQNIMDIYAALKMLGAVQ